MRRAATACLLIVTLLGWPSTSVHAGKGDGQRPGAPSGDCVQVRAEARYSGYGYDHIVHLDNQCKTDQHCEVSTDVNPEVHHVTVEAGKSTSVATFRGSPARTFEPKVECKPVGT